MKIVLSLSQLEISLIIPLGAIWLFFIEILVIQMVLFN